MTKPLPAHTKRIAQLVLRPGGITATEAVSAAEQSLESLRERGLSEIAETINRMHSLVSAVGPGLEQQCGRELYALSNSLVGVAGVFGKEGLSNLALCLCTLVERLLLVDSWDKQAIQLHLDSMRLLAENSVSAAEVANINRALRQVVDRLQPSPPPARIN